MLNWYSRKDTLVGYIQLLAASWSMKWCVGGSFARERPLTCWPGFLAVMEEDGASQGNVRFRLVVEGPKLDLRTYVVGDREL